MCTGPQNRYILNIETRLFSLHSQLMPVVQAPGMCTRPFRPRPRRDPRRTGLRPRRDRDVGHFVRNETETLRVRDETETFQLPRPWPRRMVKTVKHHKYGSTGLAALCICDVVGFCRSCTMCILSGTAAVSRPSVCSPFITLRYRGRLSWATSKIITLQSSLLGAPKSAI